MAHCPHFGGWSGNSTTGYCEKSKTWIEKSHVDNYCFSNYERCANYKGSSSCFLTTACVQFAGLADDCKELTGMRRFRDGYVRSLPNGKAICDEYYRKAPAIVEAIGRSNDRASILTDILGKVRQCVQFTEDGNNEAALDVYTTMFDELKDKFASTAQ